jgi:tetratricopeptide (TPR) repeat protein/tRNA A-37 threonylcarbamoyl transferase component Bud32
LTTGSEILREEFSELRVHFEALLAEPPEQRIALLGTFAQSNPALAEELRRMLVAYDRTTGLMDSSAADSMTGSLIAPGMQLGAYRLEKELGRGGMGVVFEASRADGSFEKRVAIKILRHDHFDDLFVRRFEHERRILAQLDHPHIASILDAGTTASGDPHFVMEFVDGIPITAYCKLHNLSIRGRLDLFLQICDAVDHAHRHLTVHRDLKPSNILVTEAGAVKLLDFGIAKLLEPDVLGAAETAALLTPGYSSPEQIKKQPITTATDIFALGILLYEILTGEHPFDKKSQLAHEVMRAIVEDDPPPTGLDSELNAIVLTALQKQPSWRYPSVAQLADDIGRYKRGWPVVAKGNNVVYRLRKFVRRQWLPLAAAALLLAILLAGIFATRRQAQAAEEARARADQEKSIAEQNQTTANQQRHLAEARTLEAESERTKAQERYRQVRSLAASLLFDLHDGIRDLAGASTVRRLVVTKAQQQLELLSAGSENDPEIQRDLAAAYERMGELRVDPAQPAKANAAGALDAYRRAVAIRRKIAAQPQNQPKDRRDLALSLCKLGDGEILAADIDKALAAYQESWIIAKSQGDPRALGTIDDRRCVAFLTAGNTAKALESCQEGIAILVPLAKSAAGDAEVQRLIATTESSYANALRLARQPQEAAQQARLAIESFDRLEALAPSNAEYRRLASTAGSILALSLAATGDNPGSQGAFRKSVESMELAIEMDPADLKSSLRLAVTLLAFSKRLQQTGDPAAAHQTAQDALTLLERATQKPSAGPLEWNEYADALLKVGQPDLVQPAKALHLAQNAVAATNRTNPFFLDTLAWAYFRSGDATKAAETEREAIRLLPADATGGLHDELQRGLETFTK